MGIQGLLQALKPYAETVHVNKYSGQRVGIDAYSWLHKGAYGCSMELHQDDPRSKRRKIPAYVYYCMHRIKMLKWNKITPVVVFDGGRLPLKALTEQDRRRKRETNLESAQRKQAEGDMLGAQEFFQRAVEITPAMAHELIEVLREEGVEFVVAPYEADAQLAYLDGLPKEKGGIAAVISEDSDLLAYGCKAVLFKMDRYGQCEEICLHKLFECDSPPEKALAFKGFTQDLFLGMCVMAGCDFLASIPGIGVKRAHAFLAKYRSIPRVLSKLKFEKPSVFPENYVAEFSQAKAIFSHARVYDRQEKGLVLLNPLPVELLEGFEGDTDFLGPDLPQSRAKAIAEGRLDPITMEAFNSVPSPRTPALTFGGNKEHRKNVDFSPSPITPLSMYGFKKDPPKLSNSISSLSSPGSKPAPSPATPFTMFGSKKEALRIFNSPSEVKDSEAAYWCGTEEELISNLVGGTVLESSKPSKSSLQPMDGDDPPEGSQVVFTHERRTSEVQRSVTAHTSHDSTEVDQTFVAQLKFIAGCSREAPTQSLETLFSQASSSGHADASGNSFKRKKAENSPESVHLTEDDSRRSSEETDPSSCLSAGESTFPSLRETRGVESDCEILPSVVCSVVNEADLPSQIGSVTGQAVGEEDESPSSVLTELSPNFEPHEGSLSDDFAPEKPPSTLRGHRSAGKTFVKAKLGKVSRSKSSGQNDRNSGGRRLKVNNASPVTRPGGGILKFFKPVSL